MTDITVQHDYFSNVDEALAEIRRLELFGGTDEHEAPASGGTPLHWHAVGLYVYITKGKFRFQDPATGTIHECSRGTKFVIPERALHIEEAHTGYSFVIGLTKAEIPQPFVRSPSELDVADQETEAPVPAGS